MIQCNEGKNCVQAPCPIFTPAPVTRLSTRKHWKFHQILFPICPKWRKVVLPQTRDLSMIWRKRRRNDPSSTSERRRKRLLADLGISSYWSCSILNFKRIKTRKYKKVIVVQVVRKTKNLNHKWGCYYLVTNKSSLKSS